MKCNSIHSSQHFARFLLKFGGLSGAKVCKSCTKVDLVKCCPTSIYLQKSASIQPRTRLSKFVGDSIHSFIHVQSVENVGTRKKRKENMRKAIDVETKKRKNIENV